MRIGIVGATGQVGGVMRRILAERQFPVDQLRLFASARSAGRTLPWADAEITRGGRRHGRLHRVSTSSCSPPARASSLRYWPRGWPRPGAVVIDNSSAWRMDPDVPLVVARGEPARGRRPAQGHHRQPELHDDGRDAGARPLHDDAGLIAMVATTYQAVSGAGLAGVAELDEQTRRWPTGPPRSSFDGAAVEFPAPRSFPRPIAFNVLPLAGSIVDDGTRRDRRGAETAQREPQDPRASRR